MLFCCPPVNVDLTEQCHFSDGNDVLQPELEFIVPDPEPEHFFAVLASRVQDPDLVIPRDDHALGAPVAHFDLDAVAA